MTTNKENSIDFSGLPRKSESRIDWGASIGCEVPFIYDGINGVLQIIDYNSPKVTVLYNDNKYAIFRGNLQKLSNWKVNEILNGHRCYDNLDFVHISQKEFNEMKEKLPEQCFGDFFILEQNNIS